MIGLVSGTFFFTVCISSIFTLFLLKLGAREKLIGFFSMLPSIVGIFSLWMIKYISKNPVKSFIMSAWILFALEICFLPVFILADFLSSALTITIFCMLLFLFYFPAQGYVYAWFPVIESIIPFSERGYFLGILRICLTLAGYGLLQISSRILGAEPDFIRFSYVVLMITAFSTFFPCFLSYAGIPETKRETSERISFPAEFKRILRNADHNTYFKFLFMWTFIAGISGPFLIPFYNTELGMDSSFCVTIVSANTLGYGFSVFGWGKVADRYGSRYVLFVSCLLAILHMFFLAHIHLFSIQLIRKLLIFSSFFGGVVFAGQLMGDTTRRMALSPEKNKPSYFACMLVFGAQLPAVISSPLAGFLIQRNREFHSGIYGIYQFVMIATGLLYFVLLFNILQMKPLKERPIIELLRDSITESLMKVRDVIASPP
ncbi:MAG: MFS transporter [Candidatus Omnitrophica bacterium]|nr:MFS transporter [Candidatus Omnitrophota bacterium]